MERATAALQPVHQVERAMTEGKGEKALSSHRMCIASYHCTNTHTSALSKPQGTPLAAEPHRDARIARTLRQAVPVSTAPSRKIHGGSTRTSEILRARILLCAACARMQRADYLQGDIARYPDKAMHCTARRGRSRKSRRCRRTAAGNRPAGISRGLRRLDPPRPVSSRLVPPRPPRRRTRKQRGPHRPLWPPPT